MATTVFYNFPELTVNIPAASGTAYYQSNSITISYPAQYMPVPNLQLNSVNYFATKLYFCANGNKNYLIVNCVDDVNSPQNYCFFTIELVLGASSPIELEKCFSNEGGNVKFTLNNLIAQNDKVTVGTSQKNCVTVLAKTAIQIKSDNVTCSLRPPENWNIPTGDVNGSLTQQSMEWNMNCAIVYDDSPQHTIKQTGTDVNNALTLFLTSLMIAGGAYTLGPALYTKLYEEANQVATATQGMSYASLDGHWGLTMVGAALASIIVGAVNKKQIFYFVAITLCITYLAASQAVKAKLNEQGKTNILSTEGGPLNVLLDGGITSNKHSLSSFLMALFFLLMISLGNAPIPGNTDTFNAMLFSFMLCATGISLTYLKPPAANSGMIKYPIVAGFAFVAILLSILWPSIAAGVKSAA